MFLEGKEVLRLEAREESAGFVRIFSTVTSAWCLAQNSTVLSLRETGKGAARSYTFSSELVGVHTNRQGMGRIVCLALIRVTV